MPTSKTTSTITSKGQITLPKPIREALGVVPGDRVQFVQHADGRVTVEAQTIDLRSLRGSVRTDVRGITLADMDAAIAEGALASLGVPIGRPVRGGTGAPSPGTGRGRRRGGPAKNPPR